MNTDKAAELARYASELLGTKDPLTFWDAMVVTRRAAELDELPAEISSWLMTCYDAEQSTDGARDILFTYLRKHAQRLATERELARSAITLEDNQRLARAEAGEKLHISLAVRRAGLHWHLSQQAGAGHCTENRLPDVSAPETQFLIALERPGRSRFEFEERGETAARTAQSDPAPCRRFVLLVQTEAKSPRSIKAPRVG